MITFQLTGDKELDRKFQELPAKVEKKVLREALRPAAKIILAQAKSNAPVLTGNTKESLKVRAAKRSRRTKNYVGIQVVTGKDFFQGQTFYAAFEEFGHRIGPRRLGDARKQFPGVHFIEHAYEQKADEAKALALKLIAEGIEREAASASG